MSNNIKQDLENEFKPLNNGHEDNISHVEITNIKEEHGAEFTLPSIPQGNPDHSDNKDDNKRSCCYERIRTDDGRPLKKRVIFIETDFVDDESLPIEERIQTQLCASPSHVVYEPIRQPRTPQKNAPTISKWLSKGH